MTNEFITFFQKKYNFDERLNLADNILLKYPDRVPIIISSESDCINIDKNKYVVPKFLIFHEFMNILRKRMKIDSYKGLFFFFCSKSNYKGNSILVPMNDNIIDIYNKYKARDKFLYILCSLENVFGTI